MYYFRTIKCWIKLAPHLIAYKINYKCIKEINYKNKIIETIENKYCQKFPENPIDHQISEKNWSHKVKAQWIILLGQKKFYIRNNEKLKEN